MATITSANSVLTLSAYQASGVPLITATQIQGYATDDAFMSDSVEMSVAIKGVDDIASFGYKAYLRPLQIHLQADSVSNDTFDTIISTVNLQREVILIDIIIQMPAISRKYTFSRGTMTNGTQMPPAKSVLQPRVYSFMFDKMTSAVL